jgi:hypothetical protein
VVALVKQPLATEEWREAFASAPQLPESDNVDHLTYAVERLLEEPHLFAGSLADDIAQPERARSKNSSGHRCSSPMSSGSMSIR